VIKQTQELLKEQARELIDACSILRYSFQRCSKTEDLSDLDNAQLERFEALTARFSRASDLLIQRVLRTIAILELEEIGTVRDRINMAEKMGLIESADTFVQIRMLRNEISHEYKPESVFDIFERVLALTPALLDATNKIEQYSNKRLFDL